MSAQRGDLAMEIDLLVVDTSDAVAIEVKSQLSSEDVTEHLARLTRFVEAFPQYRGFRLMGAVAAMVLPEEVARYAERQGLFVIGQRGDTVAIVNAAGFVAKTW